MPPILIAQVAEDLTAHPSAQIATLWERIENEAEVFDPATVKLVTDHEGYALYFSRAAIPWHRGHFESGEVPRERFDPATHRTLRLPYVEYLRSHVAQETSNIEEAEALEQLRALYHGARIHVAEARERPGPSVDTPEDLERVRELAGC